MSSCEVRFEPSGKPARVVRVDLGATLLAAARAGGLPIARACDGQGLCARCGLEILEGGESLSPETADEREAKQRNRIEPELRLACCARIDGPVIATARYW